MEPNGGAGDLFGTAIFWFTICMSLVLVTLSLLSIYGVIAIACGYGSWRIVSRMAWEVKQKLPQHEQLSERFGHVFWYADVLDLHRRLYPQSELPHKLRRYVAILFVSFALLVVMVLVFGLANTPPPREIAK